MVDDNTKKTLKEIRDNISSANTSLTGVATNSKLDEVITAVEGIEAGGLPDQTGNSGKFLTTDGTDTSWGAIPGGGDMLASVYDPQNISDDAFDTDNHTDGTVNKVYTATEQSKLSGIEALADVTDAGNVGAAIHGATDKTTPVDADTTALIDSAASNVLKKVTWANIKATLKSYFDTVYAAAGSYITASSSDTLTNKTIDANGTGNAISNLEVADLASGVLDTDLSTVAGTDTTIPSAKATKTALDLKAPIASPTFTGTVTLPTGLTGVVRTDSGVVSVDTDVTDIVSAATTGAAGKVELATTAETETGTDTGRAVTPDGLHDMTTLSGAAWFLDEDNMVTNSAVKTSSQQSIKAYVDTAIGTAVLDSELIVTSAGAGDSGKPIKLDAAGHVDATMINDADINLDSVTEGSTNKFFTSTEKTKLSGIETAADVTDATNVSAAGAPIISSGAGAPGSTPTKVGDVYIDTTGDDAYIAVGTASSSDWEKSNDGTGVGGGIENVVEDTTPQLGGSLDVNGNSIVSVSNGDISLMPHGTGSVGVGTASPDQKLHVVGTSQFTDEIFLSHATPNISVYNASDRTVGIVNVGGGNAHLNVQGNIAVGGTVDGRDVAADGTKLDGIEAAADVTDATNVAAAGAVMEGDTSTASMSFVIDEDNMASDSNTKVPTQQSVKAYVDASSSGSSNVAAVSTASTDAAKSLYTMTTTIPVEFETSDNKTLLYLDETNERVGIGNQTNPERVLHVVGDQSGGIATLERTNASTNGALGTVVIKGTSTGDMTDGFGAAFQFAIEDTANTENLVGDIRVVRDGADNTGKMVLATTAAGVANGRVAITSSSMSPYTDDALALGTTALKYADLFLAEGGVINWDNGDATITQTGNDITIGGITTFGLGTSTAATLGTVELGHASDTTLARVSAGVASIEGVNIVTTSSTDTLTNKTIDANGTGNSISNLEVADLAAGVLDTDLSSVAGTDTTLASAKAIKAALDGKSDTSHSHTIDGLSDVTITTPSSGQVIKYNGSAWVNDTDATGGGGVSDGDKGDITVSGSGETWTIDNDVVTYAKMQNISAENKILGRITAGAGDTEELTAANVRTIINVADGANNYAHPNHTGDVTSVADGATTIANSAVTLAKMANLAQNTIIGRVTASTGVPEALTATNVRTIINVEDGADVTDTTNVTAAGALMDSEVDADLKTLSLPANTTISAFGASIIDDADEATFKATVNLEIGTDVMAYAADNATSSSTNTFTNKTIDANGTGNSISNIEVADLAAAAVVTAAETIAANNNDTTIPTSAAVKAYADSVGGGAVPGTLVVFKPAENEPPATNFATIDLRNGHPVLDFDAATNESAVFSGIMPSFYGGNGVTVYIHYAMTSATSGDIDWDVAFERIGDQQLDIDSDSFEAVNSVDNTTVPGTTGNVDVVSIAFTNGADMDSVAAGEGFRLKITRDAASDTGAGDAELLYLEIRETTP